MRTRLTVTAVLLAVLTSVPAATAQGAPEVDTGGVHPAVVTFWGHVFGHGNGAPMPANTEFPRGEANYGLGFNVQCTSVVPANNEAVNGDCKQSGHNQLILFSTAGFVDVKDQNEFADKGGYQLLHNERGQTKDIQLDRSQDVTASIYVSYDLHGWPVGAANIASNTYCAYPHPQDVPCLYPYWGWDPGVTPHLVVDAQLYHAKVGEHGANASDVPPIDETIRSGGVTLVAEGRWGPNQVMNGLPGSPNVNQFEVNLGRPKVDVIPREDDFFVVYTIYEETNGVNYELGRLRFWAGEFFAPRFTVPTLNPIEVERVIPQFAHGKLAILGVINTPWGSYDVAPDGVTLQVAGPGGRDIVPEHVQRFGKFSVGHGGHYIPVNFTWVWNYHADGLQPGVYAVKVSALNYQRSAGAECTATFEVRAGDKAGPRPGPVTEGVCGAQTATIERLRALTQGAAGGSTPSGRPAPPLDDGGLVGVESASTGPANAPLLPLTLLPALAAAAILRRRSEP